MHITEIQTALSSFTRQWDNSSSSMLSKPNPKYWTVLLLPQNDPKWAAAFLKGRIHIICLFWQGAERSKWRNRLRRAARCCLLGELNGEIWSRMKIDPVSDAEILFSLHTFLNKLLLTGQDQIWRGLLADWHGGDLIKCHKVNPGINLSIGTHQSISMLLHLQRCTFPVLAQSRSFIELSFSGEALINSLNIMCSAPACTLTELATMWRTWWGA